MKPFFWAVMTGKETGAAAWLLKPFLWSMSVCYAAVMCMRRALYGVGVFKTHDLGIPVLSVGNLTVGGTGKTPLVILLAKYLKSKGRPPAILMRGYMPSGGVILSDEAGMLQEALGDVPVIVGADRVKAFHEARCPKNVDCALLDDGFQHWRIRRSLDIVVVNAACPWGNGQVLPLGILREPPEVLKRAQVVVLTHVDIGREHVAGIKEQIMRLHPECLIVETIHAPRQVIDVFYPEKISDVSMLKGRKVLVMSAIGAPDIFVKTVEGTGAVIKDSMVFMDHHVYTSEDIVRVEERCRVLGAEAVVTTQKDAVKLRRLPRSGEGLPFVFVQVDMKVTYGEAEFYSIVDRCWHS
ncbi:MAG: tetraacyldisaccharide 4'-kinase [Candidatus Omnitrophica bacterium]|nr:tetraacyldisaccharide 4'-kinase [Candidatus Omnitrophota bacterium]